MVIQALEGKEPPWKTFMTSKLPKLMEKQFAYSGYLMVRTCQFILHLGV